MQVVVMNKKYKYTILSIISIIILYFIAVTYHSSFYHNAKVLLMNLAWNEIAFK